MSTHTHNVDGLVPAEEAARERAVLDFLGHALQDAAQAQVLAQHVEAGQHGPVLHAHEPVFTMCAMCG